MFKPTVIVCSFAMCLATPSFAQETPASPPAAEQAKPAAPSIRDGQMLLQEEEYDEAAEVFRAIVEANPDNGQAWHFLGYSLHAAGNINEALPCHLMAAEFPQNRGISAYNVACVYALKGKNDQAFAWLEKSKAAGFRDPDQITNDSDMEKIKSDPRFTVFVESLSEGAAAAPGEQGIQEIAIVDQSKVGKGKTMNADAIAAMPPERQLDYWVGSWEVFTPQGAKAGTNHIEPSLNGRMILETWTSANGGKGKSMNYYDAARKGWVQVWVDGSGGSAQTFGTFKDGAMRTQGETVSSDGKNGLTRSVLTPKADGTVHQFIENSNDDGKTWTVYFDGVYKPAGM